MLEKYLTTFHRDKFFEEPDFFEKTGNFCLGLLRIGCGKILSVTAIQKEDPHTTAYTETMYSSYFKTAVIGLSILLLPITIAFALIGCIATHYSDSHQYTFREFDRSTSEKTESSKNCVELNKYIIPRRRLAFSQTRPIRDRYIVIEDDAIIGGPRAMKFLPSPFKDQGEINGNDQWAKWMRFRRKNCKEGLAITENGQHVMIQQSKTSCGPTCIAMLILDRNGTPNYEEILEEVDPSSYNFLYNTKTKMEHFESLLTEAGFSFRKTKLSDSPQDEIGQLLQCLNEHGPGLLTTFGGLMGHAIILDEISEGRATIRDPQHGWQIDISLDTLKKMKPSNFLQITNGTSPISV